MYLIVFLSKLYCHYVGHGPMKPRDSARIGERCDLTRRRWLRLLPSIETLEIQLADLRQRSQGEWLFSQALSRSTALAEVQFAISECDRFFSLVSTARMYRRESCPLAHSENEMGSSKQLLRLMSEWIGQYKPEFYRHVVVLVDIL